MSLKTEVKAEALRAVVTVVAILGFALVIGPQRSTDRFLKYWPEFAALFAVAALLDLVALIRGRSTEVEKAVYARILKVTRPRDSSLQNILLTTTVLAAIVNRKNRWRDFAVIGLLLSASFHILFVFLASGRLYPLLLAALLGSVVLLQAGAAALQYRIRHGFYGTNEYEARQIIRFILQHAGDTNLSGGLGVGKLELDAEAEESLRATWGVALS